MVFRPSTRNPSNFNEVNSTSSALSAGGRMAGIADAAYNKLVRNATLNRYYRLRSNISLRESFLEPLDAATEDKTAHAEVPCTSCLQLFLDARLLGDPTLIGQDFCRDTTSGTLLQLKFEEGKSYTVQSASAVP